MICRTWNFASQRLAVGLHLGPGPPVAFRGRTHCIWMLAQLVPSKHILFGSSELASACVKIFLGFGLLPIGLLPKRGGLIMRARGIKDARAHVFGSPQSSCYLH